MKIIGAIIIISVSFLLGYDIYEKAIYKLKIIKGLIAGFEFCRSEISFTHLKLADTFVKCSDFAGSAGDFFSSIGATLNSDGAILSKIFDDCSKSLKQAVGENVYTIVRETMLQLGTSDVNNQIKLLECTVEKLNNCMQQQTAFCNKEGVMCKKVSIIAGVAISLMFF